MANKRNGKLNANQAETLIPFFRTKYEGFYNSLEINPEIFDKLQGIRVGGAMVFRTLKRDGKVAAYLDYVSPEENNRRKQEYLARKNSANGSGPRASSGDADSGGL